MDFATAALDPDSTRRVADRGLRLGLIDTGDRSAFARWLNADARGFYDQRVSDAGIDEALKNVAYRRTTGVFDDGAPDPLDPVATVSSWPLPMSTPGERSIEAWAISSVTVAPTHRRRGLARALLEAELRTAASLGVPVAALTVSEATLYGRYGFGPAASAADYVIRSKRAGWRGIEAAGTVRFTTFEHLADEGRPVFERARRSAAGDVGLDDHLWGRIVGVIDLADEVKYLRAVRYDDVDGALQGFALYRVHDGDDFTEHTVDVHQFCAATDDAAAGLWQYFLSLDLVGTIKAGLRPVDDPVVWAVADRRAVRTNRVTDHLWVRILDVEAALTSRSYAAAGRIVFDVSDSLGFTAGRFELVIDDDGQATVVSGSGPEIETDGVAGLRLGIAELGSLWLGGVSASTLARAGRLTEIAPGSAAAVDAVFRTERAPWLSTWF